MTIREKTLIRRLHRALAVSVLIVVPLGGLLAAQDDATVSFFDLEATVPSSWEGVEPSSSMRLLQMNVPGEGGAAELVVFFFGRGQGGGVDANVERWTGQFSSPDGTPVTPAIDSFDVGGMAVTLVELSGAYARGVGGGAAVAVPDQTLLAAIIETGRGSLFAQLHGPRSIVAAHRQGFDAFLRSLRPAGGARAIRP